MSGSFSARHTRSRGAGTIRVFDISMRYSGFIPAALIAVAMRAFSLAIAFA